MRILLVYGYEPSGHASAASSLEAQARAAGHEVVRLAISSSYHPIMGKALAALYHHIIRRLPGFWKYLYDRPWIIRLGGSLRRAYLLVGGGKMRRSLAEIRPDVIVCTHAAPLGFLVDARNKGTFSCPIAAVLTDFGVNGYWVNPMADLYFAPCEEAAAVIAGHGVEPERIHVCGIPIDPAFNRPPAPRKPGQVLLTGGNGGLGSVKEAALSILAKAPRAKLVVACGSNTKLRDDLSRINGLTALGRQSHEEMARLIASSELVVGKPGGLTCAECLALGVPLVIVDPIPGQEERNALFLEGKGAAVRAEEAGSTVAALLDDPARLEALRAAALALGKPDAARRVISLLY
jgi:processive 1,2-diacylglycerol beta-glucosyltransferase